MKNDNSKIKIRLVQKKDIPILANIYKKIYNAQGENWTIENGIKYLSFFYKHQKDLFFIAEIDKKIIGSVSGIIKAFENGNHLFDVDIFIDPINHGEGVGKKLLKKIFKTAIDKYNISDIQGIADSTKIFPMGWYNRIGWKQTKWTHIQGNAKEILKNLNS